MKEVKKFIKSIYDNIFNDFVKNFKKELSECDSILDLGCGPNSPVQFCDASLKVGVELFEPYLKETKKKKIHNEYIREDILKVDFKPKSFDAVIMIDVLEHLTKEDGYKLIKKMENWSKKKIVIFTPNGFIENEPERDGNIFQEHKSGWEAKDLRKIGFKVYGSDGWKKLRGKNAVIKYKPHKLFVLISDITQKISYDYPETAFHLFAVKETGNN
ncbi:MAG: class I SAM-dependent methyltransferase [Candidatus Staskawiczbacteria bacterium]|nr:class I SAM-dependent methyltransferase [Candidatus Staskawiczbacteria bacterium]